MHSLMLMKPMTLILSIFILLILASVIFWLVVLYESRYRNEDLGFAVETPQGMSIRYSGELNEALLSGVSFTLEGPMQQDDHAFVDGIWMQVRRVSMKGRSLEEIAREHSVNIEPVTFAGMQGFRYGQEVEVDSGNPIMWTILVSPEENQMFEVRYITQDPTNQGHEQIVQDMLASFEKL